ncbi:MAG: signal recognition particle-docking protein FtsY [Clostridia bacterium]|nr:signal recognition particle-docking protein FtsY [Clostridia bacterium]
MNQNVFTRIRNGLAKTRDNLKRNIDNLIQYYKEIDDEFFEDLEAVLIQSDISASTAAQIIHDLEIKVRSEKIGNPQKIHALLKEQIMDLLNDNSSFEIKTPSVIMIIGVNGVGKTTTIGKLAHQYTQQGLKVMIAAADTFRAAAIDQLRIWADRSDITMIAQDTNSDPAAVVYDAITSAKARKADVLLVDTAGRLHNKKNLMNELEKLNRIIQREWPEANKETFIVLDATTGQNALTQVKQFNEAADITGIILTKLDGTAKGGIVVSIHTESSIPIRYIGVGEHIEDLQVFDAEAFVNSLFD